MMEESSVALKQVKPISVAAALLRASVATLLVLSGAARLWGAEEMVRLYQLVGIGQWFRYFMGGVEIAAAILIMTPRRRILGIFLTGTIVIAGTVVHISTTGRIPGLPGMLFSAALIALYLSRNN